MSAPGVFDAMLWALPRPYTFWPEAKREEWLAAMDALFKVLYPSEYRQAPENVHGVAVIRLAEPLRWVGL